MSYTVDDWGMEHVQALDCPVFIFEVHKINYMNANYCHGGIQTCLVLTTASYITYGYVL